MEQIHGELSSSTLASDGLALPKSFRYGLRAKSLRACLVLCKTSVVFIFLSGTLAPLKTLSTRMFEMLDEDIFTNLDVLRAKKVLNYCNNHSNLRVQQHEDNHSSLCVQQHSDTSDAIVMNVRENQ